MIGHRGWAALLILPVVLLFAACAFGPSPSPTPWLTPGCATAEPSSAEAALPPEFIANLDKYGIWSYTWNTPPSKYDLGRVVRTPPGFDRQLKVWKTAIFVAPGVIGTVSIISPDSARLFVTTWERWNGLSAAQIQAGASSRVDVVGCSDGLGSYPGLTIVRGPTCVVYGVQLNGATEVKRVPVSFFGGAC